MSKRVNIMKINIHTYTYIQAALPSLDELYCLLTLDIHT